VSENSSLVDWGWSLCVQSDISGPSSESDPYFVLPGGRVVWSVFVDAAGELKNKSCGIVVDADQIPV
jgi:hypothetical protein